MTKVRAHWQRCHHLQASVVHHGSAHECWSAAAGTGMLPCSKKFIYASPALGYYAMKYMRSLNMKKFYTDTASRRASATIQHPPTTKHC